MKTSKKEYAKMVQKNAKKSHMMKDVLCAFIIGGLICTLGQLIWNLYIMLGIEKEKAGALMSISLIFLASFLTGLKVFDNIAKFAGAGTLVPITGFSNAVTSPALEFKKEGMILGVGVKMFTIAGPVIVYGTLASIIYGVVYWVLHIS